MPGLLVWLRLARLGDQGIRVCVLIRASFVCVSVVFVCAGVLAHRVGGGCVLCVGLSTRKVHTPAHPIHHHKFREVFTFLYPLCRNLTKSSLHSDAQIAQMIHLNKGSKVPVLCGMR
jgi:hypothetical protein